MSSYTIGTIHTCAYCGCVQHAIWSQCPAIKSIEYYQDGTIKRVEKIAPVPIAGPSKMTSYYEQPS